MGRYDLRSAEDRYYELLEKAERSTTPDEREVYFRAAFLILMDEILPRHKKRKENGPNRIPRGDYSPNRIPRGDYSPKRYPSWL